MENGREFDRAVSALLSQPRRRLLVALLDKNPQPADGTLDTSEPFDIPAGGGQETPSKEIKMVHVHLPKLESLGFITWDRDAGQVQTGANWDEIEPLLDLLRNHSEELPAGWL